MQVCHSAGDPILEILEHLGFTRNGDDTYSVPTTTLYQLDALKNRIRRDFHRYNGNKKRKLYFQSVLDTVAVIEQSGYFVSVDPNSNGSSEVDLESGRESSAAAYTMISQFAAFVSKYEDVVGAHPFLKVCLLACPTSQRLFCVCVCMYCMGMCSLQVCPAGPGAPAALSDTRSELHRLDVSR